jgi:hypothetical protein
MAQFLLWMFGGMGIPLLGFAAARARARLPSLAASRKVRTTTFTAGPDPYMRDFYKFLIAKIDAARYCIYMTGEGFDSSAQAEQLANQLVAAMRRALGRGVQVIRLQTHPVINDVWLAHLKALITEFPGHFELRALVDRAPWQSVSLCAIDVDDPARNVTEMMIAMPRFLGAQRHKVASTAVFIEGHYALALAVRDQVVESGADPAQARHLQTAEAIDGFFRGEYYFAYGSNMRPAQMVARCPSALLICPVMLPDHRLVFNRSGTYRAGGVANIEPAPGQRVYGVLWKLAKTDFHRLDETEDPLAYRRERLRVYSLDGQPYDCHVYVAVPDQPDTPDRKYLDDMIRVAQQVGLPPEYLALLRARQL